MRPLAIFDVETTGVLGEFSGSARTTPLIHQAAFDVGGKVSSQHIDFMSDVVKNLQSGGYSGQAGARQLYSDLSARGWQKGILSSGVLQQGLLSSVAAHAQGKTISQEAFRSTYEEIERTHNIGAWNKEFDRAMAGNAIGRTPARYQELSRPLRELQFERIRANPNLGYRFTDQLMVEKLVEKGIRPENVSDLPLDVVSRQADWATKAARAHAGSYGKFVQNLSSGVYEEFTKSRTDPRYLSGWSITQGLEILKPGVSQAGLHDASVDVAVSRQLHTDYSAILSEYKAGKIGAKDTTSLKYGITSLEELDTRIAKAEQVVSYDRARRKITESTIQESDEVLAGLRDKLLVASGTPLPKTPVPKRKLTDISLKEVGSWFTDTWAGFSPRVRKGIGIGAVLSVAANLPDAEIPEVTKSPYQEEIAFLNEKLKEYGVPEGMRYSRTQHQQIEGINVSGVNLSDFGSGYHEQGVLQGLLPLGAMIAAGIFFPAFNDKHAWIGRGRGSYDKKLRLIRKLKSSGMSNSQVNYAARRLFKGTERNWFVKNIRSMVDSEMRPTVWKKIQKEWGTPGKLWRIPADLLEGLEKFNWKTFFSKAKVRDANVFAKGKTNAKELRAAYRAAFDKAMHGSKSHAMGKIAGFTRFLWEASDPQAYLASTEVKTDASKIFKKRGRFLEAEGKSKATKWLGRQMIKVGDKPNLAGFLNRIPKGNIALSAGFGMFSLGDYDSTIKGIITETTANSIEFGAWAATNKMSRNVGTLMKGVPGLRRLALLGTAATFITKMLGISLIGSSVREGFDAIIGGRRKNAYEDVGYDMDAMYDPAGFNTEGQFVHGIDGSRPDLVPFGGPYKPQKAMEQAERVFEKTMPRDLPLPKPNVSDRIRTNVTGLVNTTINNNRTNRSRMSRGSRGSSHTRRTAVGG